MFNECIYFNTTALSRQLDRIWSKAFKPFDLTPSQAFMLRAVLAKPAALQSELADTLKITRATTSRALDGLEARHLVERRATARDGRECEIYPTANAFKIQDSLIQISQQITAELKTKLGTDAFATFVDNARTTAAKIE